MDLSRLPRLPLHFFYFPFTPAVKGIFLSMMALLLIVSGWFLFAHSQPNFWSLEVSEIQETITHEVPVQTVEHRYRTVDLQLNAFRQWTTYTAGPIQPSALPFVIFIIVQLIAWSVLLGATTLIQSRWIYLFYLLFALFIHFSEISSILYPGEKFKLLEGLILLLYLGLGYAFQMNMLKWSVLSRILTMLGLSVLLFGIPLIQGGWMVAHQLNLNVFSYLAWLGIGFLFFVAKDPTNLIFWASTNHPEQKRRLASGPILAICIAWLLLVLVWIDEYMNLHFLGDFRLPLRPFHVVAICGLLTVFLSQNHFHQLKNVFSTISCYSLILLSWGLMSMSYFFVNSTVGDPLFLYTLERISVLFFLGIGFAHVLYVFTNHKALLDRKVHLYYLLARGTRYSFAVVWMIGLIAIITGEGRDGWKSFSLMYQSYICHKADHHWLEGNRAETIAAYEEAIVVSEPSPKANYNLASLILSDRERIGDAVRYYQTAADLYQFPYALMNAAQLLRINYQEADAERVLRKGLEGLKPHPHLMNNLAVMYKEQNKVDSAIQYFKASLLEDLQASSVYANLAQVYWDNDRKEEAKAFFDAAIDNRSASSAAYTNALAFSMANRTPWKTDINVKGESDYFLSYNQQLLALREGTGNLNPEIVKELAKQGNAPDAILLDAYLMFEADSFLHAISRIQELSVAYPKYAGRANFLLGTAFLKEGIPEMARKYYQLSGDAGNPYGSLYAAKMNIDLGFADSANFQLSALRVEHEDLWDECAKELAMLLHAYGQAMYAQTEWDIRDLSLNERIRISLYADSLNQFATALENFRQIQDIDSSSLIPYLEMGRLDNKYRAPYAESDISYGLKKDSTYVPLQLEFARALLYQGALDRVERELGKMEMEGPYKRSIQMLSAELALAREDTALALAHLDSLYQAHPLYQPGILLMASVFHEKEEWELGNALITTAIESNTENPEFWYYYAVFSRAWQLADEAGYGAARAIELHPIALRRQEIADEFQEELRLIAQ